MTSFDSSREKNADVSIDVSGGCASPRDGRIDGCRSARWQKTGQQCGREQQQRNAG